MSKDPAILFYTSDFLAETALWSSEEVGVYIRLLCVQHQTGHILDRDFRAQAGDCIDRLRSVFVQDEEGKWYNRRLDELVEKRRRYCESRRRNRKAKPAENNDAAKQQCEASTAFTFDDEAQQPEPSEATDTPLKEFRRVYPKMEVHTPTTDRLFYAACAEHGKDKVMGGVYGYADLAKKFPDRLLKSADNWLKEHQYMKDWYAESAVMAESASRQRPKHSSWASGEQHDQPAPTTPEQAAENRRLAKLAEEQNKRRAREAEKKYGSGEPVKPWKKAIKGLADAKGMT